ncbi:Polysaccharide deacetylase [Rhizoctonia solani]|uniref:chitin deacetylase n=1 Tax=Rhizoctonia solani TaxID=456999 RepID=A0A8H7I4M9_9AGAM|nr:Polysaccharide deacetylase [Rhizoctonia solani]
MTSSNAQNQGRSEYAFVRRQDVTVGMFGRLSWLLMAEMELVPSRRELAVRTSIAPVPVSPTPCSALRSSIQTPGEKGDNARGRADTATDRAPYWSWHILAEVYNEVVLALCSLFSFRKLAMLAFVALCSALASTTAASALPSKWYREVGANDHPVHKLFSRQTATAAVGSPEWRAKFPAGALNATSVPQAWRDALKAGIDSGKIPSTSTVPVAPLLATVGCKDDTQIYDVPDGIVALSFDDGPYPASPVLYKFLRENNQKVTHFYIGSNILEYPEIFKEAYEVNQNDIAVHTWSHQQTTTLSDDMVLAELGWCCQIIHDSTGGRLPRYWRPPYGDSDMRVRAIAKEVFGMETVIWNDDTDDWKIAEGTQTLNGAKKVLSDAYAGPKSPGLNILEHEQSNTTIKVFTDTYPLIAQNGWKAHSIPDAFGEDWYLNSEDNTSPVGDRAVAGGPNDNVPSSDPTPTPGSGNTTGTNGGSSSPTGTPQGQSSDASRLTIGSSAFGLVLAGLLSLV